MALISRRSSILGACAFCAPQVALGDMGSRGCRARRSSIPAGFRPIQEIADGAEIDQSTGNADLDRSLGRALIRMASFFSVSPGVGMYDDAGEANALAYEQSFISGTRGTVCLGAELVRLQMARARDDGVSVVAVLAHEFAHIFQYAHDVDARLAPDDGSVKLLELHADFFAGLYLAHLRRNLANVRLFDSGRTFESLGDTDFGSNDHHGTPEERVRAIEFGYRVGDNQPNLRPAATLAESIRYVTETFR